VPAEIRAAQIGTDRAASCAHKQSGEVLDSRLGIDACTTRAVPGVSAVDDQVAAAERAHVGERDLHADSLARAMALLSSHQHRHALECSGFEAQRYGEEAGNQWDHDQHSYEVGGIPFLSLASFSDGHQYVSGH
jgi:hypothetical protein